MKSIHKKLFINVFLYISSFLITYGIILLINRVTFIPVMNNVLLFIAIVGFLLSQTYFIVSWIRSNYDILIKVMLSIFLIVVASISSFLLLVTGIFTYVDNNPFKYNDQTYYYVIEGWLSLHYDVYKKENIFIMKKLSYDEIENTFTEVNQITGNDTKDIINSILEQDIENKSLPKIESKQIISYEEAQQNILNNFSIEDAIKVSNSNYAIIEVDRAMARSNWFFIEIINNEMFFVSNIPDNSPIINVSVDEVGIIFLECIDINNNINEYKSNDKGLSWVKI